MGSCSVLFITQNLWALKTRSSLSLCHRQHGSILVAFPSWFSHIKSSFLSTPPCIESAHPSSSHTATEDFPEAPPLISSISPALQHQLSGLSSLEARVCLWWATLPCPCTSLPNISPQELLDELMKLRVSHLPGLTRIISGYFSKTLIFPL